ncbi:SanA/YdcF family protein [Feifania hominis]|uniref:YdcF family protein n=1 Tax=Feifania hominis TaxID=2763660 RepID=A0A926DCQ9_9FIRM|nr:ElyC/SanA/YdcF family protein [Feifania hominis]MBC8535421.1 YdcF family protein [Feifania hominis]
MNKSAKIIRRVLLAAGIALLAIILVTGLIYLRVERIGSRELYDIGQSDQIVAADAILVLGAYVRPDGSVSTMLQDRLDYALALYEAGLAPKIIVSGDHGRESYDEVNAMREYLQQRGVPRGDIFMDHAGFSTYESIYRARDVFLAERVIIVSQRFHVVRALYIADRLGLDAAGVNSDPREYAGIVKNEIREIGARVKAFWQAEILRPKPTYLGEEIPVWGDGAITDDGKT